MSEYPDRDRISPGYKGFCLQYLRGFLAIGSVTTLTDICLLYALTEWIGVWYLSSACISYCTGALLSYALNKRWNYKNTSSAYRNQGMVFLSISSCSLLLNLGIVYTGVSLLGLSYIGAKIIATGLGFFFNYCGQTCITFRIWR